MKFSTLLLLSILLLISSVQSFCMYHWRKDLKSVKHLEMIHTFYESDLPVEKYKELLHKEFKENGARLTILSHAARQNYASEFVQFLKDKGVTDPVSTPASSQGSSRSSAN